MSSFISRMYCVQRVYKSCSSHNLVNLYLKVVHLNSLNVAPNVYGCIRIPCFQYRCWYRFISRFTVSVEVFKYFPRIYWLYRLTSLFAVDISIWNGVDMYNDMRIFIFRANILPPFKIFSFIFTTLQDFWAVTKFLVRNSDYTVANSWSLVLPLM